MKTRLDQLTSEGFVILPSIFSNSEIEKIINCIESNSNENKNFLKTNDLFAIRQLIKALPELKPLLFTDKLREVLSSLFDTNFFLTKAIYFDKPQESNWFVSYHQDLSISVDQKIEMEGFTNWTFKKGQFGVQPPTKILAETVTVRIHLDDTDKNNGALKVVPSSHQNGIVRLDSGEIKFDNEQLCEVKQGGIMLMKPLLFHASERSKNSQKRRVIHLEFAIHKLANNLNWLELELLK